MISEGVLDPRRVLTLFAVGMGTWRTCFTWVEGLEGLGGTLLTSDTTLVACVLMERSDEADCESVSKLLYLSLSEGYVGD